MKKVVLIPLIIVPLTILGYLVWKTLTLPVLYDRDISPQDITQWESIEVEELTIGRDGYYTVRFTGTATLGLTDRGATVVVLAGAGDVTVHYYNFDNTGTLIVGNDVETGDEEPVFTDHYTFNHAFLRMHPDDPAIPTGISIDDNEAEEHAAAIHRAKHPRYLSENDKVRIPKETVRVIDMEIEGRDLLIIDSEERLSLFYAKDEGS